MKNCQKICKAKYMTRKYAIFFLFFIFNAVLFSFPYNKVNAAPNLIIDGSFEGIIENNWSLWKAAESVRTYEVYRSQDTPFGMGTYSAALEATGPVENRWLAGMATKQSFSVDASNYYLVFNAKSAVPSNFSFYLEDAATYQGITPVMEKGVSTNWQRYTVLMTNTTATRALLTFTFGDLSAGNTLYIDGVQLYKSDLALNTGEIKGYIGDKDKVLIINGANNLIESDVEIELPYFDNMQSAITMKKFRPKTITANSVKIDMYSQTFSGIGAVYANGVEIGKFNYNVQPKATEISPVMVYADDDMTVIGSGFHPQIDLEKTYIVLQTVNAKGGVFSTWVKPHTIDSKLSQVTAKLPLGIISGSLYVQTSFFNKEGKDILNKSNNIQYKVRPVIFDIQWTKRGYNQVGDKVTIFGKGIANRPVVNFYDNTGKKLESKNAKITEIYQSEKIEVDVTSKLNVFYVTVTAGGIESEKTESLYFQAGPKITAIKSKFSRTAAGSRDVIAAAKVGEEIVVNGDGLKPGPGNVNMEIQGVNGVISVPVPAEMIDANGKSLKVTVPVGAQAGYLKMIVNGQRSNSLPVEIVPTVISISPSPIQPGKNMTITANGVGSNTDLAFVYFDLDKKEQIAMHPESITYSGNYALLQMKAPMAIASKESVISLQYDKWRDDGKVALSASPTITSASINLDNKVLTIKGHGFSLTPADNKITYMYADHTVITPKVKMLGVYPTEEGQEIRVQITDDYRYGYVQVKVGESVSNEMNFGPVMVTRIARRVELVKSTNQVMGVLYISGYNFGSQGGVKVGDNWATVHYRSDKFIIAVIDQRYLYDDPVIVAK